MPGASAGRETGDLAIGREETIRRLGWAGLLGGPGEPGIADLLRDPDLAGDRERMVKLTFLTVARREFLAYRRSSQVAPLVWSGHRSGSPWTRTLRPLRGVASFDAFVREQARWDFAPSPVTTAGDPWFRQHLPDSGGAAPVDAAAPAQVSPARPIRKGPDPAALVPSPAPPAGQAATSQESKRKPPHRVP